MKATRTASHDSRSVYPVAFEQVAFGSLLFLASLLAILDGIASSLLFFGLLLVFSLLLLANRYMNSTTKQRSTRQRL